MPGSDRATGIPLSDQANSIPLNDQATGVPLSDEALVCHGAMLAWSLWGQGCAVQGVTAGKSLLPGASPSPETVTTSQSRGLWGSLFFRFHSVPLPGRTEEELREAEAQLVRCPGSFFSPTL